jgi:hypothetical protein
VTVVFDDVDTMPTVFRNVIENDAFWLVFRNRVRVVHALPSSFCPKAIREGATMKIHERKTREKGEIAAGSGQERKFDGSTRRLRSCHSQRAADCPRTFPP